MYNIAEIDCEIAALEEERDCTILYWFYMGECDRSYGLQPQYSENPWYILGWHDRDHEVAIGFNLQPVPFDHF